MVKENLPPADELAPTPTAENGLKINPSTVGGFPGSVVPDVLVTLAKSYTAAK
ncbi:hypothetical protein [Niabella hibiscisoli]|uniref:hypothetical protein n=1 Tax=Niabella hibiscisoli TaxID=1825928 RepID=UPI001F0FBCBD|nr:hypothetical protein [Niabella hibiscisoli]MCH5715823.1 hypothetical protein [Niabella hibiscisoli]